MTKQEISDAEAVETVRRIADLDARRAGMSKPPVYTCCDKPSPAILEKNGRLFCRNCRAYLDKATDGARPEPASIPPPKDAGR